MKLDTYSKVIQTVIAACLLWLCLKNHVSPPTVSAQDLRTWVSGQGPLKVVVVGPDGSPLGPQKVVLVAPDGSPLTEKTGLPVNLVSFAGNPATSLPVEIVKLNQSLTMGTGGLQVWVSNQPFR